MMTTKDIIQRLMVLVLVAALSVSARPAAAEGDHGLLNAMPADTVLAARMIRSEKAAFIAEHWNRVYQAVLDSNVVPQLYNLAAASAPPSERQRIEAAAKDTYDSVMKVDWAELFSREVAIGVTFESWPGVPNLPENVEVPSFVVMARVSPEKRTGIVNALTHLLDQGVKATNNQLTMSVMGDEQHERVEVKSQDITLFVLAGQDDIIAFGFRDSLISRALTLARGARMANLVSSDRFQEAVALVPPADTGFIYVDIEAIARSVRNTLDVAMQEFDGPEDERLAPQRVIDILARELFILDRAVGSTRIEGLRQISEQVVIPAEGYSSSIIARIMSQQASVSDFARYVPSDARDFVVTSGFNPLALYEGILALAEEIAPGAQQGAATMEAEFTKETSFDLRRDVLGWISGEFFAVVMPGPGTMQYPVYGVMLEDEEKALEMVSWSIQQLQELMRRQGQPLNVRAARGALGEAEFVTITHPMMMMAQVPAVVVGIDSGVLMVGVAEDASLKVFNTMKGNNPGIDTNPRFAREAAQGDGEVSMVAFKDLTMEGAMIGQQLGMMNMFGMFMPPNDPDTAVMRSVFNILGRLAPAAAEMNFRESSASITFTDAEGRFHTVNVMNYKN